MSKFEAGKNKVPLGLIKYKHFILLLLLSRQKMEVAKRWSERCFLPRSQPFGVGMVLLLLLSACAPDRMLLPPILPESNHAELHNTVPSKEPLSQARTRVETIAPLSTLAANHHPAQAAQELLLPTELLTLNVDALPLSRFIHLALGDVLKLAIEIDANVATRTEPVTLHISRPIKAARLLSMVEDALRLYDIAIVRGQAGVRVLPVAKLSTIPPELATDHARTMIRLGRVMEFIPLNYASPSEVMGFMRHFIQMGVTGDVLVNQRLNALLVIGDAAGVARVRQAALMVDRPSLKGQQLRLIYPVYWQVGDLQKILEKTLAAEGVPVATQGKNNGIHLIAVKQINALIVTSSEKTWLNALLTMVERLDAPRAVTKGKKQFIYFVKNARAKDLGAVVRQVLSGKSGSVGEKTSLTPVRNATKVVQAKSVKSLGANKKPKLSTSENGLAVITDEGRNALIFVGMADDYRVILPLLEQLDKPPRQVLIEATIAEVTLDDAMQFGVEAGFSNVDNSSRLNGTLSTIGGLGVGSAGLAYTLVNAAGAVRLKLNALASEGRVRVLSSPRLLAMDNEPARIQIGDQVAILSQEVGNANATTGNSTGLLRNFSYVDTGVILEVTPTINEGGVVQLKLHQEVSTPGASVNNTPPISKRSVDTTMVAKSGQSVLIGGLISHRKTISRTKVPILGDIPIIGHLFSSDAIADRATELIVIITPHIINSPDDAEYLTRAFQKQLDW